MLSHSWGASVCFSFRTKWIMGPCIFHVGIFHPENNSLPGFSMNNALFLKPKRHSFDFPLCLAFWVIFNKGNPRTWNECLINIFIEVQELFGYYLLIFGILFFLSKQKSKVLYLLENEAPWTVFKVNSSLKPTHICVEEQRALWRYFSPCFIFSSLLKRFKRESSLSKLGCLETKSHLFTFWETHNLRLVQIQDFGLNKPASTKASTIEI